MKRILVLKVNGANSDEVAATIADVTNVLGPKDAWYMRDYTPAMKKALDVWGVTDVTEVPPEFDLNIVMKRDPFKGTTP